MRSRTSASELGQDALEAFARAALALDLDVSDSDPGSDLELRVPGRKPLRVTVKAMAIPSADRVRDLADRRPNDAVAVIVADQIPAPIRAELNEAGVGWLDRRGHLRLVAPGVHIDADVPRLERAGSSERSDREPIAGRSGLAAASGLLLDPDRPMGVSEIARAARLNPSSVSRAMTSLTRSHLAERRGRGEYRAIVPELFWALADAWPRERVTLRLERSALQEKRLRNASDFVTPGWVTAGVRGAVAWGAPLVATADYPLEFYVPDEQVVRKLTALNDGSSGSDVSFAVDPIGLITGHRYNVASLEWAAAHPLFCALDLTASSRDREALEQWTPPKGFTRVW